MKIKIKITTSENALYYKVSEGSEIEEDFEKYVAAVVASEIGNAPLEACKAQAVASRSFAYRYFIKGKAVPDTSSAQAFWIKRYSETYRTCIEATEATKGQILTFNDAPADTYFSHSNGGMTVSSQMQWGGYREYLISRPDPWDAATHLNKTGHGVGMSQAGAKHAAEIGINYKDILEFYYPGTELTVVEEKGGSLNMISLKNFLKGCERNASRIKGYKLGCNGSNGLSDCIGFVIGALKLEGQQWSGVHGSNYAARNRTKDLHYVSSASQLKLGELVYKAREPGSKDYDLPARYMNGTDRKDYYHVGVVTSVNPLVISHCSGGGMHRDSKLGAWHYAGYCSLVDYGSVTPDIPVPEPTPTPAPTPSTSKMVVDVPDDTSVNVRRTPSGGILTRLPEGTVVEVTSTSGEWSHVNFSYNQIGEGYIMSKFLVDGKVDVPDDTSVNVRRQPTTSASRITTIPEGSSVKVLSDNGAWSKIEYSVEKSGTGYVMSRYLRKG